MMVGEKYANAYAGTVDDMNMNELDKCQRSRLRLYLITGSAGGLHLQHPQLPIDNMRGKFGPREGVRDGVASVDLYSVLDKFCFIYSQEALLGGLVGEVDDEEPRDEADDLSNQALNDLSNR